MAIFTAQDVVDHLLSVSGGGAQDAEQRELRSAVHHAYRDLVNLRDWQWYTTHHRIFLEPSETLSVTVGGGGLTLTRAAGSWQADAAYYRVACQDVVGRVAERTSDTVLSLDPAVRFPASFDGVQSVTIYRTDYPLPADMRNMDALVTENTAAATSFISPAEMMRLERSVILTGEPTYWTVLRDEASGSPDRWIARVYGYPTASETLDFTYRRDADAPRYTGYESAARAGTATCSASASVSGTDTEWKSNMVGAVLRICESGADAPEPLSGLNPYTEQAVIAAVGSSTALTLASPLAGSYSGKKYVVTSLLDISSHMYTALLSGAEMWLARMRNGPVDKVAQLYSRDIRLAMEADQLTPISGRFMSSPMLSRQTAILRSPVSADNG